MNNTTINEGEVGIATDALDFQSNETGLTPVPRSNKKRIRAYCSCGNPISGYKNKICMNCHRNRFKNIIIEKNNKLTINSVLEKTSKYKSLHRYQPIRNDAIKLMKFANIIKQCKVCSYSAHVEVCHIKGISEFPKETLLSEVNNLDNLIYLCPNHHWELDNGLLKL